MQQIRNLDQTKSVPNVEHFHILIQMMVRERGLEPPSFLGHSHLKAACLPISPLAHREKV
jgi:hypothetical protein